MRANMSDYLRITLTERAPIQIKEGDWPILACSKRWDNREKCQANRTWKLIVRQHQDDERTIVYGIYTSQYQGEADRRAGKFLDTPKTPTADIVVAIHEVGEHLEFERDLIDQCIADLPAVEVA